jgi:pilus assembly protein CpaE
MADDMPVYLWSPDGEVEKLKPIETRLRQLLPDLLVVSSIDEVVDAPAEGDGENYVFVIISGRDRSEFLKLVDIASNYSSKLFVIVMSDEISVADYKIVLRTGAADWVSTNANSQELLDVMSRRRTPSVGVATPGGATDRKAVAISFVPSAGGVGNSTLAIEVGVHLKTSKAARDRNICLIDLDFQSSNLCDYLDIEPRLQIEEISANPDRLDSQLFDIFVSRHGSGLDVFAAPRTKFENCNLNVSALDTLFSIASTRYDVMLIDLPVPWFAWTSKVIAASKAAVVTGTNNVPGLRQTVETLASIREIPHVSDQIAVVINRCQRRLLGGIARRHHVETTLGREKIFYVGEEPMALESINTGTPMALNNNYRRIGKDIAALASFCASVKLNRTDGL